MYCKITKHFHKSVFSNPDFVKVLAIVTKRSDGETRYMLEAGWEACSTPEKLGEIHYINNDAIIYDGDASYCLGAYWVGEDEVEVVPLTNRDAVNALGLSSEY